MQLVSSRIWTRVAVSNSYDDNHYTTHYIFCIDVSQECFAHSYISNPSARAGYDTRGRIIGFILFPGVLVQLEMQSASSKIWTRVAVFISYANNHCTKGISGLMSFYFLSFIIFIFLFILLF